MPTKEKTIVKDESVEMLKQVRDLQKEMCDLQREQTAMIKTAMDSILHTAKSQRRNTVIKFVFYAVIILFSIVSTYYFYSSVGGILNGIGGGQL